RKLNAKTSKKGFSPVYIAGTDWYVAMSFVFDYGGGIAQQVSGKWKGLLNTPKSIAGLAAYKAFYTAASKASKTTDETHPNPSDWIKDFTSTSSEKTLQAKGNIPNATNLLGSSVNERAASRSWFVPTAKHWVDVENGNILRNMLAQILTGKLSIKQAANSASD